MHFIFQVFFVTHKQHSVTAWQLTQLSANTLLLLASSCWPSSFLYMHHFLIIWCLFRLHLRILSWSCSMKCLSDWLRLHSVSYSWEESNMTWIALILAVLVLWFASLCKVFLESMSASKSAFLNDGNSCFLSMSMWWTAAFQN